jgi:hypothetical protein
MFSGMEMRRRAALIAAAFAVLAAVGVGVIARAGSGDATLTPNPDPNYTSMAQRVEQTLASVPVPPDAVRLSTFPPAALESPPLTPGSENLIDRFSLWRASGTLDAAIAWFEAHPPPGLPVSVRGDGPDERYRLFQAADANFQDQPAATVAVVAAGDGVAFRIDAMAIWTPSRPASAHIGLVDSVDITVVRLDVLADLRKRAPTVHRTLTGAPAQRLADAIDALPLYLRGGFGCQVETGSSDQLIFHTRSGATVEAVDSRSGCTGVELTIGGAMTRLSGSVDAQVLAALGLPANYGA